MNVLHDQKRESISWYWWCFIAGFFILVLMKHCALYYPFIADDALISLRYADRFLQGDGLTWTAGEWVEGYSNLAWILGVSALGWLGIDLIDATRVLGFISILLSFWALARSMQGSTRSSHFKDQIYYLLPWLAALSILSTSPPIAVWVIGGLEQSLFMATLLLYYAGAITYLDTTSLPKSDVSQRSGLYISACAGALLCWTRPDGPLFIALWSALYVLKSIVTPDIKLMLALKKASPLLIWPLSAFIGQTLFRLYYYGDWIPNPAHLKASISEQTMTWGQSYWQEIWGILGILIWPALLSLKSKRRWSVVLLWVSAFTWVAYIWGVGGDIFPGHRHAVVLCGLLALLIMLGIESLKSWYFRSFGLFITLGLCIISFQASQAPSTDAQPYRNAKLERWEWHGQIIGEWLGQAFKEKDPLLAVTAAGTLPYFSKLRALDMQGLNDRHIAKTPAQKNYLLAHDHGDGAYVLARKPDLLAFRGVGLGIPAFVSGDQMKNKREFITRYRLRTFEGQYPYYVKSQLYIRLDGSVGVQKVNQDEIYFPAYLFRNLVSLPSPSIESQQNIPQPQDVKATEAKLSKAPMQKQSASQMVSRWPIEEIVHLSNFPMPAGKWSVELDPPQAIRLQTYAKQGQKSATLGIQVLSGHDALSTTPPKTYQRDHEVLVKGVYFRRIAEADSPQFVASVDSIELARQVEAQALQDPFLLKLNDFEFSEKPQTLWTQKWQSTVANSFQKGLSSVIQQGQAKRQNPILGFGGKSLLNTYHPQTGDQFTMAAWSPKVTLPQHSILSFKVGGGKLGRQVGLRVWINDIAIGTWAGNDSERLRQIHLDLSIYAGRSLQLEILDQNQGSWGHILVDDIWLSNHLLLAREEVARQNQ